MHVPEPARDQVCPGVSRTSIRFRTQSMPDAWSLLAQKCLSLWGAIWPQWCVVDAACCVFEIKLCPTTIGQGASDGPCLWSPVLVRYFISINGFSVFSAAIKRGSMMRESKHLPKKSTERRKEALEAQVGSIVDLPNKEAENEGNSNEQRWL